MYEPSQLLVFPSRAVYAYHANEGFQCTQIGRYLICNIAVSNFIVMATMCLLPCARDDIAFVNYAFDPRIRSPQEGRLGILTQLTTDLESLIMSFDVLHIVCVTSFDVAGQLLTMNRASEIY